MTSGKWVMVLKPGDNLTWVHPVKSVAVIVEFKTIIGATRIVTVRSTNESVLTTYNSHIEGRGKFYEQSPQTMQRFRRQAVQELGKPLTGKIHIRTHGTGWAQMWSWSDGLYVPVSETNWNSIGRFAFHPGGVNEAFLDGSVRFLSESTSLDVLRAMVSRSGRD